MNTELENFIDNLAKEYAKAGVDTIDRFYIENKQECLNNHLQTMLKCMVDGVIIEVRENLIKHLQGELHVFGEDM